MSETDGQVFIHAEPAPGRPAVDVPALQALLAQSGYGHYQLHAEALARAANDCNTQPSPFDRLLAQRCDATMQLQVAPDEMTAALSLTPPQGGRAVSLEEIEQALAAAGVVFGIDYAALHQVCEAGCCSAVPVAFGLLPQNGRDTVFESLIAHAVDRAPKLDENGLIDYREHGAVITVQAGAPLMRRVPPTRGVDGQNVRGRVLAAHAGRDESFAAPLVGAQVASQDGNLLQATITGQPVPGPRGVHVDPILRVAEVNMTSGNIHFEGTVLVEGEVSQGMKIQASGDILVKGMVDGGLLEAGGNIQVAGGVIANAKLRAGGSVSARFAQGASIEAGTVIALDDMALECELQSLNQIIIGAKAPQRGALIGGTARAMMLVRVPLLGSDKGGITHVVVGANPVLEEQYAVLQQNIAKAEAAEQNLEKLVKQLTAAGDPKGVLERVKASRLHAFEVWGQYLAERAELEQQLALGRSARVEVGVGVAGAVDLAFGSLTSRVRQEFDAGAFSIHPDGHIVFTDLAGHVEPV